jgi:hypothetical protein
MATGRELGISTMSITFVLIADVARDFGEYTCIFRRTWQHGLSQGIIYGDFWHRAEVQHGKSEMYIRDQEICEGHKSSGFCFSLMALNGRGGGGSRLQETAVGFIYT